MSRTALCVWLLSSLLTTASAQQMQLEIIPLNHRTSAEVVAVIKPLVVPGGTVTGMNDQLIIKSTPANLAEIKSVLSSIDRPQRRLLISVRQGIQSFSGNRDQTLFGKYRSDNAEISSRSSQQRSGVTISGRDSDGNVIRYQANDSVNSTDNSQTYTVQTLEGEPAFIRSGQSVPVPARNTMITRNGVIVQNTTQYQDVSSGFYVVPRLIGDRVSLMVAPHLSEVGPGRVPTIEVQDVQTTVSGRLGQWLDIGGIDQSSQASNQSLSGGSTRQQQENRSIQIKVDELP